MRKLLLSSIVSILSFTTLHLLADPVPSVPSLPFVGPKETGAVTYTEWFDGAEKPVVQVDGHKVVVPITTLWTPATEQTVRQTVFGDSKTAGARYLRVGFEKPVAIGSILVHGNVSVSV